MQSGKKHGMQTMNDGLFQLYTNREIAAEEALRVTHDPAEFQRMCGITPTEDLELGSADKSQRPALKR
jgi:Tfp pilus assembly ATPase PilU